MKVALCALVQQVCLVTKLQVFLICTLTLWTFCIYIYKSLCVRVQRHAHIYTHAYIHTHIYKDICVCVLSMYVSQIQLSAKIHLEQQVDLNPTFHTRCFRLLSDRNFQLPFKFKKRNTLIFLKVHICSFLLSERSNK